MNKGIYCLLMHLNSPRKIKIGKLGYLSFQKGYYCYVGSALNNLEKRIKRHLSKSKRVRWHIDYLLKYAKITGVRVQITNRKIECIINKKIRNVSSKIIHKFGSSDCKCLGHLHYFDKNPLSYSVIRDLKGRIYD